MEDLVNSNYWVGHNALVTGATGIVGSCLVNRLLEVDANVMVLVRDWDPQSELIRSGAIQQTTVINGRLEDYASVERAIAEHEIDTVFHLGAQTIVGTALRSPLATFEANVRGTYHLLEACRVHRSLVKRVVVASSDKAYGDGDRLPYTEEMPANGKHPYDVSKSCADLLARAYAETYDLPVTISRCGNIYGGGDLNWSRIVPGTIRSVMNGEAPVIRSDGKMTRDYIYVGDVVEGYLLLAGRTPEIRGEAFNFSYGRPLSVLEITFEILRLMGRPDLSAVILNEARAEIQDQHLDSSKAKKMLGWSPTYSLEEGLALTIDWYSDYFQKRKPVVAHHFATRI